MRAVNLIPPDVRRARAGGGTGSYVVLGALALLVVLASAYALTNRNVSKRERELADVQAQATAAEATIERLAAYSEFGTLSRNRVETVTQLAQSRFDWAHALHEVARTIPSDVWLTSMRGTVSKTASVEGGDGDTASLRGQVEAPAVELTGCTTSQSRVAVVMSAMRRIDGVQRVSLSSSEKAQSQGAGPTTDSAPAGSGGGSGGTDCRNGSQRFPKFGLIVFFNAIPTVSVPTAGSATATSGATTATPTDTASGSAR